MNEIQNKLDKLYRNYKLTMQIKSKPKTKRKVKPIVLPQGQGKRIYMHNKPNVYTIVDHEDYKLVRGYNWSLYDCVRDTSSNEAIHRIIKGQDQCLDNMNIHHIDGNILNNCKSNLDVVTPKQHGQIHGRKRQSNKEIIEKRLFGG